MDELPLLVSAGVGHLLVRLPRAPGDRWSVAQAARRAGLTVWVRIEGPDDLAHLREEGLGAHLPARWRARRAALDLQGVPWTAACHDAAALAQAQGATAALVSPVYPPGSKPDDTRPPLGPAGLRQLVDAAPCPVLALGGVRADRVPDLLHAGAHGVAGIGAFFAADRVDSHQAQALVRAFRSRPRPPAAP